MDIIDVKFDGNKMFYSTKSEIFNDFHFTVTKGKDADSQLKSNRLEDANDAPPTISILGLEYLFDKDGKPDVAKMEDFAEAMNDEASDWVISYENSNNYGKCLVVKAKNANINSFTFSVRTYKFDALSRSKFIDDPKTIGLTVYFDNFDTFYSNIANHIKKVDAIRVWEIPYIDNFEAKNCKKNTTTSILKGKEVEFTWTIEPSNKNLEISLHDENGNEIKKENDQYKTTINHNSKFILSVKKNGYEVTKTLDIKAVYIKELTIHDKNDKSVKAIYKGEDAKILWSVANGETAKVSVWKNNEQIEPVVKINEDSKFTIVLEQDGDSESQTFWIYKTLWKKELGSVNLPFTPDEKSNNKISFVSNNNSPDDYYFFRHPMLYHSSNLTEWEKIAKIPTSPENFISYGYYYKKISINQYIGITVYYTSKDSSTEGFSSQFYDLNINQWTTPVHFLPKDFKNDELLFYHTGSTSPLNIADLYEILFEIHEHSIYFSLISYYKIYQLPGFIAIPESKIISVDTLFASNNQMDLAILCDNEQAQYIYIYHLSISSEQDSPCCQCEYIKAIKLDRNDQKKIFLAQANSKYIVTDNYVFEMNGDQNLSDMHFSPIDTIAEGNPKIMILGQKDNSAFSAIVVDGTNASLWTYDTSNM